MKNINKLSEINTKQENYLALTPLSNASVKGKTLRDLEEMGKLFDQ